MHLPFLKKKKEERKRKEPPKIVCDFKCIDVLKRNVHDKIPLFFVRSTDKHTRNIHPQNVHKGPQEMPNTIQSNAIYKIHRQTLSI